MLKTKLLLLAIIGCIICSSLTACNIHKHTVIVDKGKNATCTEAGLTEGEHCSECGKVLTEQKVIPASGHSFGNWTMEENRRFRTCAVCYYREVQPISDSSGDDSSQNTYGSYGNFDIFLADCSRNGTTVTYNGLADNIEVSLIAGSAASDNYKIVIPSRVKSVTFIGETQGNPYYNLQIEIATRGSDIDVTFDNVRIESSRTIFISQTRNINVNLEMQGTRCSFVMLKASDGRKGDTGVFTDQWGDDGTDGENGVAAMQINGICTITTSANYLEIKGGDGGRGGDGGDYYSGFGAMPQNKVKGVGGRGGNGGNAISGEALATVVVISGEVLIAGGLGGAGGSGRDSRGRGSNGASGCYGY